MSSKTERAAGPRWWSWLALTFAVGAVLRVIGLQSGLWYDEIVTLVESARHPAAYIVATFPGVNAHPLYSLFAHGSLAIFGESAWALRLPAALFGAASVVMAYVLARSLTTRMEAWAGAAMLALSYHHIWFSQNARGYTLMGFLTLLSTWLLLRALGTTRRRDYLLYVLAAVAGIYTHLTMAFVIGGHVVVCALWLARKQPPVHRQAVPLVWTWTAVGVLSATLYAPFVTGLLAILGPEAPRAAAKVATAGWAFTETVQSLFSGTGMWATLITGVLAAIGGLSLLRRDPLASALLLMPGVVTALGMIATGQPIRPRFFFFLSGAAAVFTGRGIGALVERLGQVTVAGRAGSAPAAVAVATLPILLLSASALPRNYLVPKQDFDAAVARLAGEENRGMQVVAAGPACFPVEMYYAKSWHCLTRVDEWHAVAATPKSVLVVYTLVDYVEDPDLQQRLRTSCPVIERFAGTLRGGDIVICRPVSTGRGPASASR